MPTLQFSKFWKISIYIDVENSTILTSLILGNEVAWPVLSSVTIWQKSTIHNSDVDITISYRYYRYSLTYRNINMYFEYHNIFRCFSKNLMKNLKSQKKKPEIQKTKTNKIREFERIKIVIKWLHCIQTMRDS